MADQLYLSLWFPNFRLTSLPAALVSVMRQFVRVAGDGQSQKVGDRVVAATVYPIDWTESPIYQRIYVNDNRSASGDESSIENAVAEATEQLNDDTAYEFEMRWLLWQPEAGPDAGELEDSALDTAWRLEPTRVRIVGFGPTFDAGAFDTNGHIRVDFGLDQPWTMEPTGGDHGDNAALHADAATRIRENVEKLLAFTLSVEKHCGISSRLLWTESGEPLAEKLVASLQRLT